MLMARMVVFWSPYIMVMSSVVICESDFWTSITKKICQSRNNSNLTWFIRHSILLFAILTLFLTHKDTIMANLEDLREFWDPDTVDLMEWIIQNTPKTAAFAGTMQLLAGKWVVRRPPPGGSAGPACLMRNPDKLFIYFFQITFRC